MSTVGKRIRERRQALDLSQQELAKSAGIKQSSLSDLETGASKEITGKTLIAIAHQLGVYPEWIMTGVEFRERNKELLDIASQKILRLFATLSNESKKAIMTNAEHLYHLEIASKNATSSVSQAIKPQEKLHENESRNSNRFYSGRVPSTSR